MQQCLDDCGVRLTVSELPASTRTAPDAAAAVGCEVAQIAKSLIFMGKGSGAGYLVIASGANRVDEKLVAGLAGEPVAMAKPDFVRELTGFAIGGVPPVGHATPLKCFLDEDLFGLEEIWAAAGTPNALFRLTPDELLRITDGVRAAVRKG